MTLVVTFTIVIGWEIVITRYNFTQSVGRSLAETMDHEILTSLQRKFFNLLCFWCFVIDENFPRGNVEE